MEGKTVKSIATLDIIFDKHQGTWEIKFKKLALAKMNKKPEPLDMNKSPTPLLNLKLLEKGGISNYV